MIERETPWILGVHNWYLQGPKMQSGSQKKRFRQQAFLLGKLKLQLDRKIHGHTYIWTEDFNILCLIKKCKLILSEYILNRFLWVQIIFKRQTQRIIVHEVTYTYWIQEFIYNKVFLALLNNFLDLWLML